MPHLIISTVGTSLITNVMPPERSRGAFFKISNHREAEFTASDRSQLDADIVASRQALAAANDQRVKQLSAELNGVLSLVAEMGSVPPGSIMHVLIATDTYAGHATGQIIADWLQKQGHGVDLHVASGLRTSDLDEFRAGLADLVHMLLPLIDGYKERGFDVVFNLTGGFKGIPGFLQAVASVRGVESVYVFEGAKTLMRIPRLPLRIDADALFLDNLPLFRRLAAGEPVTEAETRTVKIPEALLMVMDGRVMLSEWGAVVWETGWGKLASDALLPPRTGCVVFSQRFEREVAKLAPERIRDVNNAIDMYQQRLEGKAAGRLDAFHFEKLKGKTEEPATHELYAWSGSGTGRIFLYEKDRVWTAHHLGAHLD